MCWLSMVGLVGCCSGYAPGILGIRAIADYKKNFCNNKKARWVWADENSRVIYTIER